MKLLLDTHVVFWWLMDVSPLTPNAVAAITAKDDDVFVSVANLWEMSIKVGIGKWPEAAELVDSFESQVASEHFGIVPILLTHCRSAGLMAAEHRDPFDRLLVAQAITEGLTLVTSDAKMASLGAPCLW